MAGNPIIFITVLFYLFETIVYGQVGFKLSVTSMIDKTNQMRAQCIWRCLELLAYTNSSLGQSDSDRSARDASSTASPTLRQPLKHRRPHLQMRWGICLRNISQRTQSSKQCLLMLHRQYPAPLLHRLPPRLGTGPKNQLDVKRVGTELSLCTAAGCAHSFRCSAAACIIGSQRCVVSVLSAGILSKSVHLAVMAQQMWVCSGSQRRWLWACGAPAAALCRCGP